jgi:hypothetical protein
MIHGMRYGHVAEFGGSIVRRRYRHSNDERVLSGPLI